jgi:NAD dependent epimerase/dehydratase
METQDSPKPGMRGRLYGKLVLVTGAGGFVGSHLVERLAGEGCRVKAFVRYTSRADRGFLAELSPEHRDRVEIVFGDFRDADAVMDAMKDIEIVFHLGALIGIPYSYVHPREVVETNVMGTLNMLMAARTHQPARLIHTSTSEVYGTAIRVPIDEDHPLQGQSPYSASKIGADKLVESFVRSFEVPAVTLRPFNTYGPRQSARAIIPTVISQVLSRDEIALGDLTPKRDFVYVGDIVEAFMKLASVDGLHGETINAGSGTEIALSDLVKKILSLVGRPVRVKIDPARFRPAASEVRHLVADNRKAKALIGWSAQVSLEEGLNRTIDSIRGHLDLFEPDRYAR